MNTLVRTFFVTALVVLTVLAEPARAETPLYLPGLWRGRTEQAPSRPPRVMRTRHGWAPYQAEDLSVSFKTAFTREFARWRNGTPAATSEASFVAGDDGIEDDMVKDDVVDDEMLDATGELDGEWDAIDVLRADDPIESDEWQEGDFLDGWSWSRQPGRLGGLWFRTAYLHWWMDGLDVPALITQSPDGTAQNVTGVLGQSTTSILVGDEDLNRTQRAGVSYTLGIPLPRCNWSLEGSYLFLENRTDRAGFTSSGNPALARPFFDVSNAANSASLVAFTGLRNGTVGVSASTEFEAAEVLLRRSLLGEGDCCLQVDFVVGYRYAGLTDRLNVFQSTNDTGGAAPGSSSVLADHFTTDNNFHGAQIGTISTYRRDRFSLEVLAKLALGNTHSTATVRGTNVVTDSGGNVTFSNAGLLVQATNSGRFETDDFAVMPELGVTLGYEINCNLSATVGYRFLYMSRVARAGDQIDLDLDLSGATRPLFAFEHTDFWAQGLTIGLDYRF